MDFASVLTQFQDKQILCDGQMIHEGEDKISDFEKEKSFKYTIKDQTTLSAMSHTNEADNTNDALRFCNYAPLSIDDKPYGDNVQNPGVCILNVKEEIHLFDRSINKRDWEDYFDVKMVNLHLPASESEVSRPIRSSFYYDALKKSGKPTSDFPLRNRTSSYDKHYLVHTDITGSGRGNSYPHRKDFAWNLLFLKQSWGANLNSPKKQPPQPLTSTTNYTVSSSRASRKSRSNENRNSGSKPTRGQSINKHPHSAPEHHLPPLRSKSEEGFRSSVTDATGFEERKHRTTGSERSRITLDSIPENGPMGSSRKRNAASEASTKRHHATSSKSERSRRSRRVERSDSKMSRFTATTYTSGSSELSRLESRCTGSATPSSVTTTRSYQNGLRVSSRSTRWDEHEGRPLAEKVRAKAERDRKVANTIRPEVLKNLVSAVTGELNSSGRTASHMDSSAVGSSLNETYSLKQHHPFTNLTFAVENSASTTRLRSSLYKTEEAQRKPTIFRSDFDKTKKQKKFNPRYHGEITRPELVDKHAHKHPLEDFSAKWVPRKSATQTVGPWTTYDVK